MLLDPFDHRVKSFVGQEVGEEERTVAADHQRECCVSRSVMGQSNYHRFTTTEAMMQMIDLRDRKVLYPPNGPILLASRTVADSP